MRTCERSAASPRQISSPWVPGRWRQVLRDPVVRMATEAAIQRLKDGGLGGSDDLELVLELAASVQGPAGQVPTQAEERGRLQAGPGSGIWLLRWAGPP